MSTLTEREQTSTGSSDHDQARRRVERRRKFFGDLAAYVLINVSLVGVWAVTGAGYFWPGWVLFGWGVLLSLDAWKVYQRPVTDADVEAEMQRHTPSSGT
jgi:hypothetical protein